MEHRKHSYVTKYGVMDTKQRINEHITSRKKAKVVKKRISKRHRI